MTINNDAGEPCTSGYTELAPTRWDRFLLRAQLSLSTILIWGVFLSMGVFMFSTDPNELAEFSVDLADVEGLVNARTVSPSFNLTVRVANPSAVHTLCLNGGEALVSYAGVGIARSHVVPALCVPRGAAAELTVVPWGWDVGLTEDVRRRLVSEWRVGAAEVSVEMKIFHAIYWMPRGRTYS
ncbi:hypothetical protein BRADI_1g65020v3, partial [Brachypodium distachyon]